MLNEKIYYGIVMAFAMIICLGIASGLEYHKQLTEFDIKDTCTIDGFDCDNTFMCNYTVISSNGTLIVNNSQATKLGIYYYQHIYSNQSYLDTYEATLYCVNGSNAGQDTFNYIVNQTGKETSNIQGFIYIFLLILAGLLCYGFYIYAKNLETNHSFDKLGYISKVNYKKPLRLFFYGVSYLLLIWFMWLAYQISYSLLPTELGTTQILYIIWNLMFWSLIPLLIIWFIVLVISSIRTLYISAKVMKGYMVR